MAKQARPTLNLRLSSLNERDGEVPLSELARVAEQTQRVVTRLARGLVEDRGLGRASQSLIDATRLSLVGLKSGSTVLQIAGPRQPIEALAVEGMPSDLSEMAIEALVGSLECLVEDQPFLPFGVDSKSARDIDDWLRALRGYERVILETNIDNGTLRADVQPVAARKHLRKAETQPSIPYVSADHQALTGRLYALNLRTGSFSIEDDAGHSIRLSVPEDMRSEAAQLADRRVRAVGNASLDDRHRLVTFDVTAFSELPSVVDQAAFFERHDLAPPPRAIANAELAQGVIPELSDDEIDAFVAALREQ